MKSENVQLIHRSIVHGGLPLPGTSVERADLTDKQRIAVVLQAAALLSLLEQAERVLPGGWDEVRVHDGTLLVRAPVPGRLAAPAHVQLRSLLHRLFEYTRGEQSDLTYAGRGPGRRAARRLSALWHQTLLPASADRAVSEVFDAAPFLWEAGFDAVRESLVGEIERDATSRRWLAGPGGARRRCLAGGRDMAAVKALLRRPEGRDLWEGFENGTNAMELFEQGRYRRAVVAWRRQPPQGEARLCFAECLIALGRFAEAADVVRKKSTIDGGILYLRCLVELNNMKAALKQLTLLTQSELTTRNVHRIAPLAVRLAGQSKNKELADEWVNRAARVGKRHPTYVLGAHLVAAEAAEDRGDYERLADSLEKAADAASIPELRGSYHKAKTRLAIHRGHTEAALKHARLGLQDRRRLSAVDAARHWSELAAARLFADDLPGAERAARHAARLSSTSDGPLRDTLGLPNLAEIRLRRGRLHGVTEILEMSTAMNLRFGNLAAQYWDKLLWARHELTLGQPLPALTYCRDARLLVDEHQQATVDLLSARAHGWLGRKEKAASCLERLPAAILWDLEPEERPAVWALAGHADQAAEIAWGTPWETFWAAHLQGLAPPSASWNILSSLEPFRAARFVFDCEMIRPGLAPTVWVRQALVTFHEMGASGFADRLESSSLRTWQGLRKFLEHPRSTLNQARQLLSTAGYVNVRLSLHHDGQERLLVDGSGGEHRYDLPFQGGTLVLDSPVNDETLACFAKLIQERLAIEGAAGPDGVDPGEEGILGDSEALAEAIRQLDRLAVDDKPLLIRGETGTGKELAARRCHRLSRRSDGPFRAINCGELTENLIQSELFGHVKGAFTGADKDRAGIFESARGGTVFLDEIGDLPKKLQASLLRVLQQGEVRRIGENGTRKIDVRVVAATHQDLPAMVEKDTFRRDLYYRLNAGCVELPALRDRGDDVLQLARTFIRAYARAHQMEAPALAADAERCLRSYVWPGNVRELKNVVESAVRLVTGGTIRSADLKIEGTAATPPILSLDEEVRRLEVRKIQDALERHNGNKAKAARDLGLTRQGLSYRLRRLGIV